MNDQTVIHLANVLAIAAADGAVDAAEETVLRDVVARLGAGERELAAARALLARRSPYQLQAFEEPAACMAVIEDMVMMSLADGKVTPHESRPLDAFLEGLGYAQADIDMVVRRVRARLGKILRPPPLRPSPPPLKPPARAASPALPRRDEPRPAPPDPPAAPTPADDARGEPAPSPPAPAAPWKACARRRADAPDAACYCFGAPEGPLNPWGCRLAGMPWDDGAAWFRLGRFRDAETFVFDRDAIGARLRQRLAAAAGCPFLLPGFAQSVLEVFPSRATLCGRWRPHAAPAADPGAPRVTVRTYPHGCVRQTRVPADGLTPAGDRDARLLIRRTVRRTGAAVDLAFLDKREKEGRT